MSNFKISFLWWSGLELDIVSTRGRGQASKPIPVYWPTGICTHCVGLCAIWSYRYPDTWPTSLEFAQYFYILDSYYDVILPALTLPVAMASWRHCIVNRCVEQQICRGHLTTDRR